MSEGLRLRSGLTLCSKCPICGSEEEHACFPYTISATGLERELARQKLWREHRKADICGFCEEALAVADTQSTTPAPICSKCVVLWLEYYPDRPCVPREGRS